MAHKEDYSTDVTVNKDTIDVKAQRRRGCLKWLLWIVGALLLILLLAALLRSCQSCAGDDDAGTPYEGYEERPPEIDPGHDISVGDDSLSHELNNRVLLIIKHGGTVSEFAHAFRRVYPDEKRYILSNPDTTIARVVVNMPREEKRAFKDSLAANFPDWDLVVIPEKIYGGDKRPSDPGFTGEADKHWYFDATEVYDAWDITEGDTGVVVAIIDDGFDLSHPEIKGKVVKPYNAVTHDSRVFPSKEGHGMHVAATAVGRAGNGSGVCGIAPRCRLMPIQVGDKNGIMTNSAIIDAILYAIAEGADVVNLSLGMKFTPATQLLPLALQEQLRETQFLAEANLWNQIWDMADERNITIVQAGGNENILIGIDPMKRSARTIRVSATQPDEAKADFSNFGDYSTLSAPGVKIYNAVPSGRYEYMDGTSMSSPIVAGGVALLKSQNKDMPTADIIRLLRATGRPSSSPVGPIVNFGRALRGDVPPTSGDDCAAYQRQYDNLLRQLEKLKREHGDCLRTGGDTLRLPARDLRLTDFKGTFKSTSGIVKTSTSEPVELYFTFDGTPRGSFTCLNTATGLRSTATLTIAIRAGTAYVHQDDEARGPDGTYNPYDFTLKAGTDGKAEGYARNRVIAANQYDFTLVKVK